jgi:hypothetical protein
MVGRELTKDEEVDHKDRNKLNFHWTNLVIRGHKDHGWVSAAQSHFMRHKDEELKREWDEFMAEKDREQATEIAHAKANGKPWKNRDGQLRKSWESEHGALCQPE